MGLGLSLVGMGCSANGQRSPGFQLRDAASRGDVAEALSLLNDGVDVDSPADGGNTALIVAAMSDDQNPVVPLLLDADADVDARDELGSTALTAATGEGHVDNVRQILRHEPTDDDVAAACRATRTSTVISNEARAQLEALLCR